jgi:sulfatase-modifying factor enzyme 1
MRQARIGLRCSLGIGLVAVGLVTWLAGMAAAGESVFVGLTPCRAVDTRGNGFAGAFGPPSLPAGVPRDFPLAGQCGVPAEAQGVSLNVTATNTLGPGFFLLSPAGSTLPLVSTLNYVGGETVANAALVPLGPGGLTVIAGVSAADLILDVNGYFVDIGLATATACPPSMVRSGPICVDRYEASVWETSNPLLVAKIRAGSVTLAELQAGGAVQRGVASDDYGTGCPDTGNGCVNFYAVSLAGVPPSGFLTWFQAAAAARNAGKRLPTSAEWQVAALGTPNGAPCVVSGVAAGLTGTAGCVSDVGAFDMVGNLGEWVADWVPTATDCSPSLFGTGDHNCMVINPALGTPNGPGVLTRGGSFIDGAGAGVFTVFATGIPTGSGDVIGFRAVR